MQRLEPAKLSASLRAEAASRFDLPYDMLRIARRRVRVAAGIGMLAYALFLIFGLSRLAEPTEFERRFDSVANAIGLGLCAAVLAATAFRRIGDRTILGIALAAQVLLCALISITAPRIAFANSGHIPALTWVVPVVILFPLLVPASPLVTLMVSAVCAATVPVGLWILEQSGAIAARTSTYWAAGVASALAAAIAVLGARTIYGAGRQMAAVRRVGSYELLDRLGQGGMGEVWKARHTFLARPAAVKLILPATLQGPTEERDAVVLRFTREAQTTASLRSPHTVTLFDFGTSAGGDFYYAMELLDGMNIEHFVYRFGPVEPRRVVNWLLQACHSLGEAHANGLVHRDIKPANVFLCRYGRDVDFVKLLDFGLSKPVAAPEDAMAMATATADPALTTPGERPGTPGYMAPEQVFGLAAEPRTDLYALGCVGYFLLAGRKPFESKVAGELMRQHAQATPPPLATLAPHPVPQRLQTLIAACLAKTPADRPRDADELARELDACASAQPWTSNEARAWWNEHLATT